MTPLRRVAPSFALALALALIGSSLVAGADDLIERRRAAREIADELMSPFCPGRTLSDCPSPNATQVKEEIRAWVDAGIAPDDIRERLLRRFGTGVDARADRGGQIAAVAVLLAVATAFALGLRRILRPATAAPPVDLDPDLRARLERELEAGGDRETSDDRDPP
jgi:cytochrome c-type biogenesis protein CcmH/NrfF